MKRHTLTVIAATLVLAAPNAQAKAPAPKAKPAAAAAPKARGITRTDFLKRADQDFAKFDRNGDSQIDDAEIQTEGQTLGQSRLQAENKAIFARLDADRNGSLSPEEFAVLAERKLKIDARPMLSNFDSNRDGRISALEYRTGKITAFNAMDADRNGTLSAEEIRAARKRPAAAK